MTLNEFIKRLQKLVDAFFKDQEKLGQCNGDCYYIYPGQEVGIL